MTMRLRTIAVLFALGVTAAGGACGDDSHATGDADSGADADADGGADVDGGADADADADGETDGGPNEEIIPANRRTDWSRAGVPGGIPERDELCATIDADVYGDGATNAAPAINDALEACGPDQVVYLPPGTYRLDETIDLGTKSRVTLRGAGMGRTILEPADDLGAAIATGQAGLSDEIAVLGGSTKGSTEITVADASGIEPGMLLDIIQAEDPDFYWSRGGAVDHTGQFVLVTEVSGTTIRFEDPLVWGFDRNPRCRYQLSPGIAWTGVEDLTITAGAGFGGSMIQFWNAYASWIKNVETAWGNGNEHLFLFGSLRCEVRGSYIHDTHSTTDGYGILTAMGYSGPRGGCTGTLIEDNIFSGLWYAMVLETEVGSVIAYNFSRNMRYAGWPDYQMSDFNGNHGPHGMLCLFEGNVLGGGVQQDGYHGSVSHTTYYRNAISGRHVETHRTGNIKLFDLCRYSYYHNVVGNVLGSPDWPRATIGQYEMTGNPDYLAQAVIYRLGYPNMGNNWFNPDHTPDHPADPDDAGLDPKVAGTLLRWGNYDYQHDAARWEASELPDGVGVPSSRTLPGSLRYADRPAWWPAELAWPPIGPDLSPMVGPIPAQVRYEAL
jgi:hypothetical protein